jgi:hypothetical protein
MKPTLLSLALALVSPFAFAQTSPDNGETENPVTPPNETATTTDEDNSGNGETENPVTAKTEGAITTTGGSVAAYAPDEMIAVITEAGESKSFVIGPSAKYQDPAGNDVEPSAIKEGSMVQITAEENGEQMVASRIEVDS